MSIQLDASRRSLLIVRPLRTPTDAELNEFLTEWRRHVEGQAGVYAVVLDLRRVQDMPAAQRKRLTDSMKTNRAHDRCRGCAMVFESAALKLVLTAIFWIFKPKYPTKVFTSEWEALAWAQMTVGEEVRLANGT